MVWLAPEPQDPFRRLTETVMRSWPSLTPYGKKDAEIVPHLTVGIDVPVPRLRDAEASIDSLLPIRARAVEVVLMTGTDAPGSWSDHSRYRLGR